MQQKSHKATSGGFTFIEVICTLVLLSFMAFTVIAALQPDPPVRVEAEVLKSNLRYAESLALANNTAAWRVRIDAQSYTLLRDPPVPGKPLPWPGENSNTHTLAEGGRFTDDSLGDLLLNTWGAPIADHQLTLAGGGLQVKVMVLADTGFIP